MNPGPPPCQGDDLPSELPAHKNYKLIINKLSIKFKKRIKELSFLKNLIEKQNRTIVTSIIQMNTLYNSTGISIII